MLSPTDATHRFNEAKANIKEIYKKHDFLHEKRVPSVKQLAIRANLLEVYEFLYSATSQWVHFNPHILLRMGWAPSNEPTDTFSYTTKHFSNYYASFNAVYGTYLFGLFYESFGAELNINPKVGKYVEERGHWIGSLWRWPEIITFEEMNIKRPSEILIQLANAARGLSGKSDD